MEDSIHPLITLYQAIMSSDRYSILELSCSGDSLVHCAVRVQKELIAQLLIEHGNEVNACNRNGETPLYIAASMGNEPIVKLLLKHGADVTAKHPTSFMTALHYAALGNSGCSIADNHRDHVVKELDKFTQVVDLLVQLGADPNVADVQGQTPLHCAAALGNYGMVVVLIAHGANIAVTDKFNKRPLDYVPQEGLCLDRDKLIECLSNSANTAQEKVVKKSRKNWRDKFK